MRPPQNSAWLWPCLAGAVLAAWFVGYSMGRTGSASARFEASAASSGAEQTEARQISSVPSGETPAGSRSNDLTDSLGEAGPRSRTTLEDFERALRSTSGKYGDTRQAYRLYTLALRLDAADLPGAVERAEKLPHLQRGMAMQVLGSRWAEIDPPAAAAHALSKPDPLRNGLLFSVLNTWGGTDPDAALAWAKALPDARLAKEVMIGILHGWAGSDSQGVLNYFLAWAGVNRGARRWHRPLRRSVT